MFNSPIFSKLSTVMCLPSLSVHVDGCFYMHTEECAVHACVRLCLLPHEVVIVEAIPCGGSVYIGPLWRDE